MIQLSEVVEARSSSDGEKISKIYREIFFDGSRPKVKMWLVKKGVHYNELDEVFSKMNLSFMLNLHRYKHDKIEFEKYIWTCFNQELLNHFHSKKLKKNSTTIGVDDVVESKLNDSEILEYEVNIGFVPAPEINTYDEYENFFLTLTQSQALICRMVYYSDYSKSEICEYLGIKKSKLKEEMENIRIAHEKYFQK